ncbi:UDP-2,4-diacetamido-2,4,6-trideoxy-beta-L-altropyranose hydrolase [Hymenobacter gummosus]|uniref:UDP-2,4-diacetamido-2,4, 6-trideoxy-beta-L-altropyranose hydrolase n=1 Tax=Hymenobacter gummosus TaxID=1776032 RepID=A0A431U6D8_9BACT|nr:UDP-2,4-diacetamido-2,4,6-trideoxy-beta-L-altropyranose hydrolase [Hymenobacter gummosus]RTQ52238.1 UDP-2,4-diacetamido-2,4,6-trideoxy-beta-L-altropyranose hydrolase [Hymenobacter gummosus]
MNAAPPLPRLVLRADGNATIGLGHVVRLLALAELVRDAFHECLLASRDAAALAPLLTAARCQPLPLPADLPAAAEARWLAAELLRPTDVLLLDGYGFDADYQRVLRAAAGRLVYVDDLRAWPVEAQVLINHSPGITPALYQTPHPDTTLLLGPEYALLRPEVRAAAAPPAAPQPIRSVLLCFGGADPLQLTARCLPLLLQRPELREIGLLPGPANPGLPALHHLAAAPQAQGRVVLHAPAPAAQLVQLLGHYDCLLGPASTILIEALILGRPALTGYYADNQRHLADFVAAQQQAYSVGDFTGLDDDELAARLAEGLQWLAATPRQPYARQLRPEELRARITAPLPAGPR